jgi:hypothetical protein
VLSLEFLLKILSKEDSLAVDVFFLIGLMPAGFSLEDLKEIFKSDLKSQIERLEKCSLIERTQEMY